MDWQGDDYFMQGDSHLDTSSYLWDGVNHNEDDLLRMFDEMTPVKACADFNYDISDNDRWYSEGADKGSGECRESSQLKRRRMLQFGSGSGSDVPDPGICNEQAPYDYGKSKDIGNPMEGAIPENMQGVQSFSGWSHQSSDCFVSNLCMKDLSSATQLSMEDSWLGISKS